MVVYKLAVQMHDRGKQGVWGWAGEELERLHVLFASELKPSHSRLAVISLPGQKMHVLFPLSRLHLPLLHLRTNPTNLKMSMTFAEAAALRKAAQNSVRSRRATRLTSHTSEVHHRPPPKPTPDPIVYEAVARPGAYYERPKVKRDLPVVSVRFLVSALYTTGL